MGMNLLKISKSKFFLNTPPQAKETKERINKRRLIDLKRFCIGKDNINKMKRQRTVRKNISESDISDKGRISNIYWINIPQNKEPIKIWAENLNRHFSKEGIQMVYSHMKRCSTSLH